jgi:hypothetical protein
MLCLSIGVEWEIYDTRWVIGMAFRLTGPNNNTLIESRINEDLNYYPYYRKRLGCERVQIIFFRFTFLYQVNLIHFH